MNMCAGCGREITSQDIFESEYTYCRSYCCKCCPTKNGYRGESCHKDYIDRTKGEPVGFIEVMKNE